MLAKPTRRSVQACSSSTDLQRGQPGISSSKYWPQFAPGEKLFKGSRSAGPTRLSRCTHRACGRLGRLPCNEPLRSVARPAQSAAGLFSPAGSTRQKESASQPTRERHKRRFSESCRVCTSVSPLKSKLLVTSYHAGDAIAAFRMRGLDIIPQRTRQPQCRQGSPPAACTAPTIWQNEGKTRLRTVTRTSALSRSCGRRRTRCTAILTRFAHAHHAAAD